jgi:hypothetical protein
MTSLLTLPIPTTLSELVIVLVALIILWVIVSIPVYFASKLVTGGKSSFSEAMKATLGGGLVYFIVFYGVDFLLGLVLGPVALILGFILALLAWLAVYRSSFKTNWFGALGIVLVAWVFLFVLDVVLGLAFGVSFPKFYPF